VAVAGCTPRQAVTSEIVHHSALVSGTVVPNHRRTRADPTRQRRVRQPGGDPRRDQAAAGSLGLLRATPAPGTIQLEGDTAVGRSYITEFGRFRDGSSHVNYAVYTTATAHPPTAGGSRSASTRSGTSTPLRWRLGAPRRGRSLTRRPRTRLRRMDNGTMASPLPPAPGISIRCTRASATARRVSPVR